MLEHSHTYIFTTLRDLQISTNIEHASLWHTAMHLSEPICLFGMSGSSGRGAGPPQPRLPGCPGRGAVPDRRPGPAMLCHVFIYICIYISPPKTVFRAVFVVDAKHPPIGPDGP